MVREGNIMAVSEKTKEKLDEAGREIKDAIDNLRKKEYLFVSYSSN
jgi:hypothetical protein